MEEIVINTNDCTFYHLNGICGRFCVNCANIEIEKCETKQLKRKEKECEKLKKKVELLLNQLITLDEEDITVQISQEQFDEYTKLKQALQEIKEICKPILEVSIIDRLQGETYTGKYILAEKILQIIQKVKEQ